MKIKLLKNMLKEVDCKLYGEYKLLHFLEIKLKDD